MDCVIEGLRAAFHVRGWRDAARRLAGGRFRIRTVRFLHVISMNAEGGSKISGTWAAVCESLTVQIFKNRPRTRVGIPSSALIDKGCMSLVQGIYVHSVLNSLCLLITRPVGLQSTTLFQL